NLATYRWACTQPYGMILNVGPTGSGKTTTLYSGLSEVNDVAVNIMTAEDPIEYPLDGINQMQMLKKIGLDFARALRCYMRMDPDIILVGEIRDLETAQIAVQASLTGHLVMTTLHTNDAPSSIIRLLDLGMESFLLTATIEGIVAQRLVRVICPKCKEEYEPGEEELMELALRPEDIKGRRIFRGRGCDNCHKTGYRGRMAIFEILGMDDEIRDLVMHEASTTQIRDYARQQGMRMLRESGLMAIYEGQTTIDEVVRETIADD
ncbi:MAG: type II/IV secretion system protein, partial [Planctomycetes bacterium]|nr:type II/IV secretion system protein [Planctomycetota bacterium]